MLRSVCCQFFKEEWGMLLTYMRGVFAAGRNAAPAFSAVRAISISSVRQSTDQDVINAITQLKPLQLKLRESKCIDKNGNLVGKTEDGNLYLESVTRRATLTDDGVKFSVRVDSHDTFRDVTDPAERQQMIDHFAEFNNLGKNNRPYGQRK